MAVALLRHPGSPLPRSACTTGRRRLTSLPSSPRWSTRTRTHFAGTDKKTARRRQGSTWSTGRLRVNAAAKGARDAASDEFNPGSPLPLTDNGTLLYSEASRKYRRTVYRHEDWLEHRASPRIFKNLSGVFTSGVVRSLLTEVAAISGAGVFVVMWNALFAGYVDLSNTPHPSPFGENLPADLILQLPALPFTLASPALGLLLVFRTNSSYTRWLEARKAWGHIVSHLRNLQRQAGVWMYPDCEGKQRAQALGAMRGACWTLSCSLQAHLGGPEEETLLMRKLYERLPQDEAETILDSTHRPLRAIGQLSRVLDGLCIDEKRRVEMDKSIVLIGNYMETCERIFSSPVPLVYTRHTARFLSVWLLLLPLGLWSSFDQTWNHIGTIPASTMAAILLFGIEELAVQLEEPFSILPLEALCQGVWDCAEQMHGAEALALTEEETALLEAAAQQHDSNGRKA